MEPGKEEVGEESVSVFKDGLLWIESQIEFHFTTSSLIESESCRVQESKHFKLL